MKHSLREVSEKKLTGRITESSSTRVSATAHTLRNKERQAARDKTGTTRSTFERRKFGYAILNEFRAGIIRRRGASPGW